MGELKKEFIPYEQSLALKQLGFDKPCFGAWVNNELFITEKEKPKTQSLSINQCTAPLYQQAFRWFREKYGLFAEIKPYLIVGTDWWYKISDRNNSSGLPYEVEFETYEEAELACLIKLIEIVKTK
jgi:hypothetical protein